MDRSGTGWGRAARRARGGRTRAGRCPRGPRRPAPAGSRARDPLGPDERHRPAPEPGPPQLSLVYPSERPIIGSPLRRRKGWRSDLRAKRGENRERAFAGLRMPETPRSHALYCPASRPPDLGPFDEADLPAEEAQASPDPRVSSAQPYPIRSGDPEAAASEGPQAPHSLALASEGRPDARRRRLSRSGDFDRVYREGDSCANRFLVVYSFARRDDEPEDGARLGLSVGRKIGKAVTRNKVRRAVRESFWELSERIQPGRDYVIVARPGAEGLLEREGQEGVRSSLAELMETGDEERLS